MSLSTTFNVKTAIDDGTKQSSSIVKSFLLKDREGTDLSVLLNCNNTQYGSVSGMQEQDYPSLDLPQVSTIKNIPLPPELVEQFAHVQCNSLIGVFPEIGRIWIAVDSDVFIWHYKEREGLAYFDGLSEAIFNVALVRPKEGIFQQHIRFLLVLTTLSDIVLLGVSFTDNDINKEMHLLPDPLFTIPADHSGYHTIGTDSGRIFTGGKDGCLYEVTYKGGGGWFSRKCNKINHSKSLFSFLLPKFLGQWLSEEDGIAQICEDDTRNILYTRSNKSTIVVYDLGEDGQGMGYVSRMTIADIQTKVRSICNTVDRSNFTHIVHIAPISKQESRHLHLVAITHTGVRLYFVTSNSFQSNQTYATTSNWVTDVSVKQPVPESNVRPSMLSLIHVRLPPGFTPTGVAARPSSITRGYSNNRSVLLSSETTEGHKLWCMRRPSFPGEKVLMESYTTLQLDGKLWVMTEIADTFDPRSLVFLPPGVSIPPDPPIQVQQHFKQAPEFITITDQGCYVFSTLRPIDQLRYLLETNSDINNYKIKFYFDVFGMGEGISAAIIIATCSNPTDEHLKDKAVSAFYAYAGKPSIGAPEPINQPQLQQTRLGGFMSPIPGGQQAHNYTNIDAPNMTTSDFPVISTPMSNAQTASNFSFSQQAANQQMQNRSNDFCFSNMHAGLYKTFSRFVRPLWDAHVMQDTIVQRGNHQDKITICSLNTDVVSFVIDDLMGLKVFIENYCLPRLPKNAALSQMLDETVPHSTYNMHQSFNQQKMANKQLVEAVAEESKSIKNLYALLKQTIEILGLWRIASTHQINALCQNMDKNIQNLLKLSTLESFILNSKELSSMLISAFVNFYIHDSSAIDVLNDQLQSVCPSLYSPDDAVCSKAFELISTARSQTGHQRHVHLEEALHLFRRVSHVINVQTVVQQFQNAQFYTGIVELCTTAAYKCDEKNIALHFYKNETDAENDVEGRQAFVTRNNIYGCITAMLDELIATSQSNVKSTTQIGVGPPQPATEHSMSQEEAERHAEMCIQLALKTTDELLHIYLYQWMLVKGFSKKLLNVKSPFVEQFLKKVTADHSSGFSIDLLWTYYEINSNHVAAANILANLAEVEKVDMKLSQRIEYLSRAKMNCKSATADSEVGQMLHTLEEKLEVAQIQLLVLNTLKEKNLNDLATELDAKLVDITTLYNDYADAYNLAECKLAIVHCAGHFDTALVNTLWQDIIKEVVSQNSNQTSQSSSVIQKLVQLGKQYVGSGRYFPTTFLVSHLEKISCENQWPLDCIATFLLQSGVLFPNLIQEYDSVYAMKEDCWNKWGRPYHIVDVISSMLDKFADNPSNYVTGPSQRQFTTHSLDILAVYLVQLQSVSLSTEHLNTVKQNLKNNQAKIIRLEQHLSNRY